MAKTNRIVDQGAAQAAARVADGGVVTQAPHAIADTPETATALMDAAHQADRAALVAPSPALHQVDAEAALLASGAVQGGTAPAGFILIVCQSPGLRRAGLVHGNEARYPLDFFTQEQLNLLQTEPRLYFAAIGGTPVARQGAPHRLPPRLDPVAAGDAAADAISRPPNRSGAGMRNAAAGPVAGYVPRGRTAL